MVANNATYDYIIAGGGCAGLSLLYQILLQPTLQHKRILVIEASAEIPEKTWCFWEKQAGIFDKIANHSWSHIVFKSPLFSKTFSIQPYSYKTIDANNFYQYIINYCKPYNNINFVYETVTSIKSDDAAALVTTNKNTYKAALVFNATSLYSPNTEGELLQHFAGIKIKTHQSLFHPHQATFMNFCLPQVNGYATFMYELPVSSHEALIEYTLFSPKVLDRKDYEQAIEKYLIQQYNLLPNQYGITHKEYGVIPMSRKKYKPCIGKHIINIGTAAGCVKPSTGFAFSTIQQYNTEVIQYILGNKTTIKPPKTMQPKYRLYDNVLLNILLQQKEQASTIFAQIFSKNKPITVLKFLNNETSFWEDLGILNSVNKTVFIPEALKQLFNLKAL